jgi:TATA-box binding protein (TBP) (component of TFIID and TFIIIB)
METAIDKSLRISTMTLIAHINSLINLQDVYEKLDINDKITYIAYADKSPKGKKPKEVKRRKKDNNKKRKYFYNQVTLHIKIDKIINVKIFNNGGIQMTGLKKYSQSDEILTFLTDLFYKKELIQSTEIKSREIVLINSDFDLGFKINREKLHRLVTEKMYYSSFEPIIYPGVNIKYYYNQNHPLQKGICQCDCVCNGKGKNGDCKKITLAVFNSGKALVTGGRNPTEINTAYNFITTLIDENKDMLIESEE